MNPFRVLQKCLLPTARTLRVATYSTLVFGLLAGAATRSVHADVREVAFGIGHELGMLEDLTADAYLIRVNGAEIHRSSARTDLAIKEVLDRYQAYCAMSPSVIGRAMTDIPQALEDRVKLPKGDPLRQGIVREEDDRRGMVACFADDGARGGDLGERLRAFRESGDLSVFGRFRYVFVERMDRGGSHVVTLWADGPLNVGQMFPAVGDAPGTDSALVPRPTRSRRTFSASADGFPAAVRIYEVQATRSDVSRELDASFASRGFSKVVTGDALAYLGADGAEVLVSLTERD
ncbi:MAG TPA: hypothetical protein VM580_23885, partial [Labilithrix sp.]|nr:hypothetical protein [Labilithrix sp.]